MDLKMKDSIDYYITSKRCFIEQFELLQILFKIEKTLTNNDIALNEEEANMLVIQLQKEFCNIYYKDVITDVILQEKYQDAVKKFDKEFDFDDDLQTYLDIKQTSKSIKKDFNDNFHQYLFFYSQLNLASDIKNRLDFKNIKILMNIDEQRKSKYLIEQFDNVLQAGLASNGYNTNASRMVKEHRLQLMKQAGIIDKDAKQMTFSDAIEEIQIRQQNKTTEEIERENQIKAKKKKEVNEYIKKFNSSGR